MNTRSVLLRPGTYGMVLILGAGVLACSDDDDPQPAPMMMPPVMTQDNIVDLAQDAGLTTLVNAASTAGLASALSDENATLTVFAPTNDAFAALGAAVPTDPELLANVLLHHVVNQELNSSAVTTQGPFTTLANTTIAVDASANPPTIGGAALSSMLDVEASNGIVHILDAVMVPPTIVEAVVATDDLATLETAVGASSQAVQDVLASAGPLTVFAPINSAFANIDLNALDQATLDNILQYHVVSGQTTSDELVDGATIMMANGVELTVNVAGGAVTLTDRAGNTFGVTTADIRLLNGVVHLIDGVLDPTDPNQGPGNIVEVAAADGNFATLIAAATRAGLAGTLSAADATLTVFAPTDAAFTALGVDLMLVPDAIIGNILLQHVLDGDIDSAQVLGATAPFTTLAKLPLAVDANATPVTIGGADLSTTIDVDASNGRIHVMDEVIVPPTVLQVAQSLPDFSDLANAVGASSPSVQAALNPNTLDGADPITVFAPVNSAFAGIDLGALSQSQVDRILSHHLVIGQALSTDLTDGQIISTANGDITVNIAGTDVSLTDEMGNTVNVIDTDIRTLTGVIHVIDGVLMPLPTIVDVAADAGFTSLIDAAVTAGLAETLTTGGPFTVFAPSNAAFAALTINPRPEVLANILLHHVVPGVQDSTAVVGATSFTTAANTTLAVDAAATPITIGGADLGTPLDLAARNGIVHVMDEVIVPPSIVDVASETPSLSSLVAALGAATLVDAVNPDTLAGEQPLTVFAPTNDAFTAAGVDLNNPPANLAAILTYHVVAGQVLAGDLTDGQVITTLQGGTLTVDIANDGVFLIDEQTNRIEISATDIRTLTGVVHVIDGVLLP